MNSGQQTTSETASRWIWPFELKQRLGEGGMGVVYRARYVVNDREVAVKMLPSDVKNPVVLARFERELDVLKNLKHPNIVRSFGGVCEDNRRFYAMELVEGGSLEELLQERGRLPWEQVVEYGKQMCAALAYLHEHGVVHRDVKPANFLIAENKQLKLSDFGLASVIAARRITTAGKTAGTILYMAPEQIRGGDVTPQTDLYALGCVLYELLAGKPPFVGDSPAATMNLHCSAPAPRVSQVAYDCPPALESLICRLLAKEAHDRPANAVAVARELSRVTPTVQIVPKQRPIDSDELKPSVPSSAAGRVDGRFKETRDVTWDRYGWLWRWMLIGCMLIMAGLSVWIVNLQQVVDVARRSEELWIEAAQSPNEQISKNALVSLGGLRSTNPEVVEVLRRHLSAETENSPAVRRAAAEAFGEMGALARSEIGFLYRVRDRDPHEVVRVAATEAIDRIQADEGPDGSPLIWLPVVTAVLLSAGLLLAGRLRHRGEGTSNSARPLSAAETGIRQFQNS